MIQRFATIARRLNEDLHLRLHRTLTDIVSQLLRTHSAIECFFVALRSRGDDTVVFDYGCASRGRRLTVDG